MVVLETERLLLRPLTPADLDDLAAIQADPAVMQFFPRGPRDREATRADITGFEAIRRRRGFSPWAAVSRSDGRLVGRCGLLPITIDGEAAVEVNYLLARTSWGRGLATEAARAVRDLGFGRLGLDRLVAVIAPGNARSVRVAEKLGMDNRGDLTVGGHRYRLFVVRKGEVAPPISVEAGPVGPGGRR